MRRVGLTATASYLPRRWMPAAEVGVRTGLPEQVVIDRLGLRGKHIAGDGEQPSDMATAVGRRLLEEQHLDPRSVDAVVYFGSTWKDHAVWHAAPHVAHRLGCRSAFALELDYVSCGAPVALRVIRALLAAEPTIATVLAVAASRESHLIDLANPRTRFSHAFGDGAVAALVTASEHPTNEILGNAIVTDGSFSLDVLVPAGGSAEPASQATVAGGRHLLDATDPDGLKTRLDPVTIANFVLAADGALQQADRSRDDIDHLCITHLKPSTHAAILEALGLADSQALYLDDTGHMSGVDPLLALDRAARTGRLHNGDIVMLLAAGTGYSWAATVLSWGPGR